MSRVGVRSALCVHGAGGGGWEWGIWARVFSAAGIEVVAPDLRCAAPGLAATTLDDYSRQVAEALIALPRPRVLVGASLGGLLAVMQANAADALVLVNPLPPLPWAHRLPTRERSPEMIPWGREASLTGTRAALPDADAAACLYAARRWRDESGAVLNAAREGVLADRPEVPVLVLVSGRDDDVPAALSRELAQAWQASLIALPQASHAGPLLGHDAARCAAQVLAWLDALPWPQPGAAGPAEPSSTRSRPAALAR